MSKKTIKPAKIYTTQQSLNMEKYSPIFNISPEILSLVYEIASNLERLDMIRDETLAIQLRKKNRIKTIHSSLWIEANTLSALR